MQMAVFRSVRSTTPELTSYTRFVEAICSQSRVSSSCLDPIIDTNAESSKSRLMGMEQAKK